MYSHAQQWEVVVGGKELEMPVRCCACGTLWGSPQRERTPPSLPGEGEKEASSWTAQEPQGTSC